MCLLVHNNNENSGVPKKAEKPIKVYKMLINFPEGLPEGLPEAPLEAKYFTACRFAPVIFENGEAVLHAKIGKAKVWKGDDNLLSIEKGIHAYTDKELAEMIAKCVGAQVFEAVIPEGGMYVDGIGDEIVSDYLYIYEGK